MPTTIVIRHRIGDYEAWRAVYEGFADAQRAGGVLAHAALRSHDDPADIVVFHTFADRPTAEAYLANRELRGAMAEATVDLDSVTVEFFDEVAGSATSR